MIGSEQRFVKRTHFERATYRLVGIPGIGHRIRAHCLRIATANFDRYLRSNMLDAGSGSGAHSFYLARRFPNSHIVGVDLDGESIKNCEKIRERLRLANLQFLQRDLLGFSSKSKFSYIFCFDALEHIKYDRRIIRSFHSLLLDGGRLIVHIPSRSQSHHFRMMDEYLRQLCEADGAGHVRDGYTEQEITSLLGEAGFKIAYLLHTFGKLGTLALDLDCSFSMRRQLFFRTLLFPFIILLARLDFLGSKQRGNGILIIAERAVRGYLTSSE